MEDWIREDYFLKFDIKNTTLLPRRDLVKHLPLYKKKGEEISDIRGPRLFTLAVLQKHGVQEQYELYEPNDQHISDRILQD